MTGFRFAEWQANTVSLESWALFGSSSVAFFADVGSGATVLNGVRRRAMPPLWPW